MIQIIYGHKGSGKTKRIIDCANDCVITSTGDVAFIADTGRYIHEIKYQIRFTNTKESDIGGEDGIIGFIYGMIAANYDVKQIFIDGLARMSGKEVEDTESVFKRIEKISDKYSIDFYVTVSRDLEQLPPFIKKYVK